MAEGRRIRVKFTVPFPGHFFTDDVKIEKSRHAMGEWVLNVDAPWKMHMNTKISGCRPDKNNKGAAVKTEIGTTIRRCTRDDWSLQSATFHAVFTGDCR